MIGKHQTAGGALEYVSTKDSALDVRHKDYDLGLFIDSRDKKHRPIVEGKVPTVFHLKPLTLQQYEAVRSLPVQSQDRAAVAFSLERVDDFLAANGAKVVCAFTGDGQERRLDVATLEALFAPELFAELAIVVARITGLDPLAGRR